MNNNTYSTIKSGSLFDKAAQAARVKIYKKLETEIPLKSVDSIIDIGCTADREQDASNFFEKFYPYPSRITALSNQNALWMEDVYKGLKFVQGNALHMPFEDNSFDLAFSSAVIEHVGSRENQRQFVRECIRVSGKYICITTPNRWYPLELHTVLPFVHWLPANMFRSILKHAGKSFFASEDKLNLLCKKSLMEIMRDIGCSGYTIDTIRFLGAKSNLLLIINK